MTRPAKKPTSGNKSYREMSKQERAVYNAFYGGVCCTLSAAGYLMDGTSPEYLEAVGSVGPRELLNYAIRERDMELPRIRKAVRFIENERGRMA